LVDIPFWPFKKKKKRSLSRERFLLSRAVINPVIKTEESEDGTIILVIPVSRSGLPNLVSKSLSIPEKKKVQLDEVGSKVWRKIDGNTSMSDLSKWMESEFKISQREAEVSLSTYFQSLTEKNIAGMIVPPPKPGTQEAVEEAAELRKRSKELQELHRKGKITEEELKEAQQQIDSTLEIMGESDKEK
jgi:hypothetical protein